MTTTTLSIGDRLGELRDVLDKIDELNASLKGLNSVRDELEGQILAQMEAAGQTSDGDKITANGITVTRRTKWRAKYNPEQWEGVVKWAAESGNLHVIQRRLTDARVMELVDNGVALPEGLSVESYPDLDFRRSK